VWLATTPTSQPHNLTISQSHNLTTSQPHNLTPAMDYMLIDLTEEFHCGVRNSNTSHKLVAASESKSHECVICMDELGNGKAPGSALQVLPCMHVFHEKCVSPALNIKQECPICRTSTVQDNTADAWWRGGGEGEGAGAGYDSVRVRSAVGRHYGRVVVVNIPVVPASPPHHAPVALPAAAVVVVGEGVLVVPSLVVRRQRRRNRPYVRRQVEGGCDIFIAQGPHCGDNCGRKVVAGTTKCGLHKNVGRRGGM